MSDGIFCAPALQGLKLTLDEAQLRQQAIATNLANINTPGFQRMDVNQVFSEAYSEALHQLENGEAPSALPPGLISKAQIQPPEKPDGNTVELEPEMVSLTQNSARYQFASEMLANNYHGLKYAITGTAS
jgi:flagellar basal-body rod protein FlgB